MDIEVVKKLINKYEYMLIIVFVIMQIRQFLNVTVKIRFIQLIIDR